MEEFPEAKKAYEAGDYRTAGKHLAKVSVDSLFAIGALKHSWLKKERSPRRVLRQLLRPPLHRLGLRLRLRLKALRHWRLLRLLVPEVLPISRLSQNFPTSGYWIFSSGSAKAAIKLW